MGGETDSEIYTHMIQAGIAGDKALLISSAHGLKGGGAREFVIKNKILIGAITEGQQISLFNAIYPEYVKRAISIYDKWTSGQVGKIEWDDLDPIIRDVLVDFVYQGFTAGPNPMRSGMHNNKLEMITYIESTRAINQCEPGRQRAKYLRGK